MKILVACEESQSLTMELLKLGHDTHSCDLQECGGPKPESHIVGDARRVFGDHGWDAVIAFPPCTHLASSGARWFKDKRSDGRQQAGIDFFLFWTQIDCQTVAIENPIGIMSTIYRKPDQIIQPWQHGHGETKATCLWLKGLDLLEPTNIVEGREARIHNMPPSRDRSKIRSKTYKGIAKAMANQWFGGGKHEEG